MHRNLWANCLNANTFFCFAYCISIGNEYLITFDKIKAINKTASKKKNTKLTSRYGCFTVEIYWIYIRNEKIYKFSFKPKWLPSIYFSNVCLELLLLSIKYRKNAIYLIYMVWMWRFFSSRIHIIQKQIYFEIKKLDSDFVLKLFQY